MTVSELINKLSKVPGEMEIEIYIPANLDEDETYVDPEIFVDISLSVIVLAGELPPNAVTLEFFE